MQVIALLSPLLGDIIKPKHCAPDGRSGPAYITKKAISAFMYV